MSALARLLERIEEQAKARQYAVAAAGGDQATQDWSAIAVGTGDALALVEMARLLIDMADAVALARGYIPRSEQFEALDLDALLARFAKLEQRAAP